MPEQLTLPVRGMHCAACVGKVESALAGVPGVETASVNLATERATVAFDPARADVGTLQAAVAAAGYELAEAPTPRGGEAEAREQAVRELEQRRLGRRWRLGALLSVPLLVGGMPDFFPWAPAWLRDPWVQLGLSTPVQLWVGATFHAGFLRDLRHRTASMDTLVSLGTSAAYVFSVALTLWPHVFHAAGRHALLRDGGGGHHARPAGALARGPCPWPHLGGDPAAREPGPADRPRAP